MVARLIYAWAYLIDPDETVELCAQLGIGAVLYPGYYEAAENLPALAYVPSAASARDARRYPFAGFIAGRDEPNVSGYSGPTKPPAAARADYEAVAAELQGHPGFVVPASLGGVGGFWRTLLFRQRFDAAYHEARGVLSGVAWAPSRARLAEIRRSAGDGPTVLSPALYQGPNHLFQVRPRTFVQLAREGIHVAVWCLREADHQPFGLYDRSHRLTAAGRRLRDALRD